MNREALQRRLLATFRDEAGDHVRTLETETAALLADAEAPGARARLETLFRVVHTLKGAARSVRLTQIEAICQTQEEALRAAVQSGALPGTALLQRLNEAVAQLRLLAREAGQAAVSDPAAMPKTPPPQPPVAAVHPAATTDMPPAPSRPSDTASAIPATAPTATPDPTPPTHVAAGQAPAGPQSVRVGIGLLDRILSNVEDMLLPSLVGIERAKEARHIGDEAARLASTLRRRTRGGAGVDEAERKTLLAALRGIEARGKRLAAMLAEDQRAMKASTSALFRESRKARMLPASAVLDALPDMIADLCAETGKRAKLRVRGGGIELDRKVIEAVKDPLIHIVRNAIDHGIEAPSEREAAGKPPRGRIAIVVSNIDGKRVAIEISDDGRGMDGAGLRAAALRARVADKTAIAALSDDDALDLAFRSGVSTRTIISKLSGMGMGMAIVQDEISRIDGRVAIRSTPGKGATIRLELPTSIASFGGLLVMTAKSRLLWPGDAVLRVIGIGRAAADAAETSGRIVHDGHAIPYRNLARLLGLPEGGEKAEHDTLVPCVIVGGGGRVAAFQVDRVVGETDILVKELPPPLIRVRNISSAGLLPTGEIALVLRPGDLLAAAQSAQTASVRRNPAAEATRTRRILVVDDSLTTRTMERNLLESVGYEVDVATDGVDAWNYLQNKSVDLIVSDVDMPGMDGFELTSRVRGDAKLADLPIVLVTAMESRDDRDKGIRVGANSYVLKSAFDQSNLLEIVRRLI